MLTPHLTREDSQLRYESVPLAAIAEQFGTPTYVYSRSAIVENFREYKNAFASSAPLICYAVKANSTLSVLALLASEGAGFDIVSTGELKRVIAAGGDPGKVIFSGVAKRADEIAYALSQKIYCFNVESEAELHRVNTVAIDMQTRARITFRINPDVDPKTHPYISTGLKSNKFGIAHTEAVRLYRLAASMHGIEIAGIECHIGSQITELGPYADALKRLLGLVDELSAVGIHIEHLDLGGGRGIVYGDESVVPMSAFADEVQRQLAGRHLKLLLEPGRSIVGNAGVLVTRVEYLKPGESKNFAIVDAGMNDLLRPTLYDAFHPVEAVLSRTRDAVLYDIVGPVCESGDWLAKARALALEPGDLIAVLCTGAYGMVMASNYNTRNRPCEVMVDRGEAHLIRERESFEDLIAHERIVV
ncbi:MAG: diaminopimelate decarboxylase [Betaproteobacteria bacterium]|nr:MAG: diaminopimelate decarboxylase [Betaproteobacteria bacterium]